MPIDIATEEPSVDVCRYLRRWTHPKFVEQEIARRHTGVTPERRRRMARDAAACLAQGLELIEAARSSSVLTKPLGLFYAAEAMAKAVSIVASTALDGSSFRAHGLQGVKKRRYFIRTLTCKVQNPGSDVWSRLCAAANFDLVRLENRTDGVPQVSDHFEMHSPTPRAAGTEIALAELLRQLPELADDVSLAGMSHPLVVHCPTYELIVDNAAQQISCNLTLRHAANAATKQMILSADRARGYLRDFRLTRDVLDVLSYSAGPAARIFGPERRSDIFGRLYMNFVGEGGYLAELPAYYAALFILSDAVRYQGQWQKLLADHPEEEVLVDRFLEVATRKLPNLALNHLAGVYYMFAPLSVSN
jgi:hypothetical protein